MEFKALGGQNGRQDSVHNCILCGKPLLYAAKTVMRKCAVCQRMEPSNAACEAGHFVCDICHTQDGGEIRTFLLQSKETDPIKLYLETVAMHQVHLHGPEHHSIIPCVLLAAYHNCGGQIDREACISEAWKRGCKVAGGACGFLGACGAAVGAGIFISILCGATPLAGDVWDQPQRMVADSLSRIVETGGPRCCKRTGRQAIEAAAAFAKERYGVEMPLSRPACTYSGLNGECIRTRCPYFERV